jgi:hypothetical protein
LKETERQNEDGRFVPDKLTGERKRERERENTINVLFEEIYQNVRETKMYALKS